MGRSISSIENDIKNASARISIAEQSGDPIQVRNARSDLEKFKAELISTNTQALIDAQNAQITKTVRNTSSIENDIRNASARISIAEQSGDPIQVRNARSDLEKFKAELISTNTQALIDAQNAQIDKNAKRSRHTNSKEGGGGIAGPFAIIFVIYVVIEEGLRKEARDNPDCFIRRALTIGILLGILAYGVAYITAETHHARDMAIVPFLITTIIVSVLDYIILNWRYKKKSDSSKRQ